MPEPVYSGQGTRLDETPPWMTYAAEMEEKLSEEMAEEVAEYAKHYYEDGPVDNQTQEELCFQREVNTDLAKQYQWLEPEEYADIEQRIGIVMTAGQFITKLRGAGVTCWYLQHPQAQKATLVYQEGTKEPQVGCWVQQGQMPELSIMNFDRYGIPLAERRRGWRTCLLQLIMKSVISEDKAVEVYGKPKTTPAFDRYNATLYEWRKRTSFGIEE